MEPTSFSPEKTMDWTEVMSDLRGRVRGRHEVCIVCHSTFQASRCPTSASPPLKHANLATTMIYTHVADKELEKAMSRR